MPSLGLLLVLLCCDAAGALRVASQRLLREPCAWPATRSSSSQLMKGESELFSQEAAEQAEQNEKRERLTQLFGESAAAAIAQRTNLPDK